MGQPSDALLVERLAVVVVHGMGEQRPRHTLVPFSRMLLEDGPFFSRPTRVSGSYEARYHHVPRFAAPDDAPVDLSIYEYHWSYRMKDNRLKDLGAVAFRTLLPTNGWRHLVPVILALGTAVYIAGIGIAEWQAPGGAGVHRFLTTPLLSDPPPISWSPPSWRWSLDAATLGRLLLAAGLGVAFAPAAATLAWAARRGFERFPAPGLVFNLAWVLATVAAAVWQLSWPLRFTREQFADVGIAVGVGLLVGVVAAVSILGVMAIPAVDRWAEHHVRRGSPRTGRVQQLLYVGGTTASLVTVALLFWPYSRGGAIASAVVAAAVGSLVLLTPHGLKGTLVLAWAAILAVIVGLVLPNWQELTAELNDPEAVVTTVVPIVLLGAGGATALGLLLGRVAPWLTTSFVDVVRYVDTSPRSYEVRRDVQRGLVELLGRLHEDEYDRIVVVAHSLGSFISYDAISSLWYERTAGSTVAVPPPPDREDHQTPEEWQEAFRAEQAAIFAENARRFATVDGVRVPCWRISDLVTFGSPMYMADRLLTRTRREFVEGRDRNDYFTCPPPDGGGPAEARRDIAAFGVVRWTNLWYRTRLGFFGDPFGGPLAPLFGPGIHDDPVADGWRSLVPYGAHALYTSSAKGPGEFARAVRDAVFARPPAADAPPSGSAFGRPDV